MKKDVVNFYVTKFEGESSSFFSIIDGSGCNPMKAIPGDTSDSALAKAATVLDQMFENLVRDLKGRETMKQVKLVFNQESYIKTAVNYIDPFGKYFQEIASLLLAVPISAKEMRFFFRAQQKILKINYKYVIS
ncbi:MAG: hypothetical protein NTX66_00580 [Candidatus Falkowbacteria bacterium]|nr:hypothetical protein [Candidatus Falkowbacteria bacterium]